MIEHRLLHALVEEDSADSIRRLLGLVTLEDVARAWCAYHRRATRSEADPDWWAVELWMTRTWWDDSKRPRAGIEALVAAADADEELLGAIGAGPLEQFVDPDENTLRWIESRASALSGFRAALRHVWLRDFPETVAQRLDRAAGIRLERVPP